MFTRAARDGLVAMIYDAAARYRKSRFETKFWHQDSETTGDIFGAHGCVFDWKPESREKWVELPEETLRGLLEHLEAAIKKFETKPTKPSTWCPSLL